MTVSFLPEVAKVVLYCIVKQNTEIEKCTIFLFSIMGGKTELNYSEQILLFSFKDILFKYSHHELRENQFVCSIISPLYSKGPLKVRMTLAWSIANIMD